MIPRRVGNLTPVLCDITDDLHVYLEEVIATTDNGLIEDITSVITKWAFQSASVYTLRYLQLASFPDRFFSNRPEDPAFNWRKKRPGNEANLQHNS